MGLNVIDMDYVRFLPLQCVVDPYYCLTKATLSEQKGRQTQQNIITKPYLCEDINENLSYLIYCDFLQADQLTEEQIAGKYM